MYDRNIRFSAIASEDIKNHTICVYNHSDNTVRNFNENYEDICFNNYVYIDQVNPVGKIITDIEKGTPVRCTLIRILI